VEPRLTSAEAQVGTELYREQDRYWNDTAPELLLRAIDQIPDRFDAVIIDEGQDFRPNWWTAIALLSAEPDKGALYVFYDPAQCVRLPVELTSLPDLGKPHPLKYNCRNTREIAIRCGRIRGVEIGLRPAAPSGNPPSWVQARTKEEQVRECTRQVNEWVRDAGPKYSQIALLCMGHPSTSSLSGLRVLGRHSLIGTLNLSSRELSQATLSHLDRWRAGESILVTSIRRFRGLESDTVIIFDLPELAGDDLSTRYLRDCEQPTKADLYVALSRAKHLATVVSFATQPPEFG